MDFLSKDALLNIFNKQSQKNRKLKLMNLKRNQSAQKPS